MPSRDPAVVCLIVRPSHPLAPTRCHRGPIPPRLLASGRTLHDLYGLEGSLTARDAWAGSFAPILTETLPAPRSDCPAAMPEPPAPSEETRQRLGQEWTQPLNDWQVSLVRSYAALNGQTWDDRAAAAPVYGLKTEYEGQLWMRRQLAAFKARLAAEAEAGEAAV